MDADVVGSADHALQQARIELVRDQGHGQERGELVPVAFAGEDARALRQPLDLVGQEEVCWHDEEGLDVARHDGLDPTLSGVEPREVREVGLGERAGPVHVADRLRLLIVAQRPDDRHGEEEDQERRRHDEGEDKPDPAPYGAPELFGEDDPGLSDLLAHGAPPR